MRKIENLSQISTAKPDYNELVGKVNQYRIRFEQYAKMFKDKYEFEFDKLKETVVTEELCAGSDMTLGYYCPSPVIDLLVGNVHRGRILKRVTKRSKPVMKYGFNDSGKMVVFYNLPPVGYTNYDVRGFVLYEGNTVTYLCFRKSEGKIYTEWIAQAEYDKEGRIICYTLGSLIGDSCRRISQEMYTYSGEHMEKVIIRDGMSANRISQDIYLLHYDKDGYITGYEVPDDEYWKGHIFEITPSKRRKI